MTLVDERKNQKQSGERKRGYGEHPPAADTRAQRSERESADHRANSHECHQKAISTGIRVEHVTRDDRHHREVLESENRVDRNHPDESHHFAA